MGTDVASSDNDRDSEIESGKGEQPARFGLYGDLPTRILLAAMRVLPQALDPIFIYPASLAVWALAGSQRRAIARNLARIPDRIGSRGLLIDTHKVFLQFAWAYAEGLRTKLGQAELDWEEHAPFPLDELPSGCVLLTAHTANYDIAASAFADRFDRVIHVVRAAERNQSLDELRREMLASGASERLKIHYNDHTMHLGVELARALERGEVVAVQADRIVDGVSATEADFPGGGRIELPRGPVALIGIAPGGGLPLFVIRCGRRRYRVLVGEPLKRRDTDGQRVSLVDAWVVVLHEFLREHWSQWFVFEDAFIDEKDEI